VNAIKNMTIRVLRRILPENIRKSIFHLSFHLAREEYEKFAHLYSNAPNMYLGLSAMTERGFRPATVVDVGAFMGDWGKQAKRTWPSCKLIMIEPNLAKQEVLAEIARGLDADLFCELLGAQDGREVQFHVMESGSSVMAERSAVLRTTETRRLCTLDSLLSSVKTPAFLKIDAQGYELEILKGAAKILPAFEAVLLEVATIEINIGAPLLHEVTTFMKDRGFVAYDILEIHRRPLDRALNQVDIVFISERSRLLSDKRHFA
jgi:FkbM family methyltransferase